MKGMFESMDEEVIVGKNPVIEALKSGRSVNKIIISEHLNMATIKQVEKAGEQAGTVIQKVPKSRLNQVTKGNHQGIIAYVASYQYASIEDLFQRAEDKNETPFFIILDELEDPHNLGSILRTADATVVHGIIISKNRSVGLTATVANTSTVTVDNVQVDQV